MTLKKELSENISMLKNALPIGKSFDIIAREMQFGRTRAYWVSVNGMYDSDVMQLILSNLQNPLFTEDLTVDSIKAFIESKISFGQVQLTDSMEEVMRNIVSGPSVLLLDGCDRAVLIDVRRYPVRSIQEPDAERVMKGARDGFVETMLFNANLIRRRIRSPHLTFEITHTGTDSKTDTAIAYVAGAADSLFVDRVREAVRGLHASSLTMGAASLAELLVKRRWFNPMPSLKMTERPDVACSYLMEGHVLIIVDNSPSVIILPCTVFQFTQAPEDYYKSPAVGTLYRFSRLLCMLSAMLLMPVFLLVAGHMPELSARLHLLSNPDTGHIKLLFFALFAEFGLELLKYASSHTITSLSGALSIVGGLILSDIAIQLEWVSPEVIFYSAATMLATLAASDADMADALRLYRLLLILTTGLFGVWGFYTGLVLVTISVLTTPTFGNKSYFWPLIPFNGKALKTLLWRQPTEKAQPENTWARRRDKP